MQALKPFVANLIVSDGEKMMPSKCNVAAQPEAPAIAFGDTHGQSSLLVPAVTLPRELLPLVRSAQTGTLAAASTATDSILHQQRLEAHHAMRISVDNWATTIPNTRDASDSIAESPSKLAMSLRSTTASKDAADPFASNQTGTLRPPPDVQPGDITLSIGFGKGAQALQLWHTGRLVHRRDTH
jgi:hypothetical protein